ncbi:MAG TPA: NAD-dependent epimerase/dehydratase family protein [Stellaceae bacterium]|nr:NAD-dependent epimerase/dehydratase family protein [Stellaceae bacterium]
MTVLVTGAAGFIGFHVSAALLKRGERVLGVDNLNGYYDVTLKEARLAELRRLPGFAFERLELAERGALEALLQRHPDADRIVHLAAQAGVRYSLTNPHAYIGSNIQGHLEVLEACRALPKLKHLVYASSSSVYGGNTKLPFSVADRVDTPHSLYAATKKADELMSYCYSHLFRLPTTGLRFFTVYGPWGRPDMAAWLFTEAILAGKPIRVFNHGNMRRDFTFIDDIVAGVVACLDRPPSDGGGGEPPCRLYNIGNHRSEDLKRFIALLEKALGRQAIVELEAMQPGDVPASYADIAETQRDLGFTPTTPIDEGLPRFVAWYRAYHRL